MQHYLNILKMELEDNLKLVKRKATYQKEAWKLCNYLNSHKPEIYRSDSIAEYSWIIHGNYNFSYKTSAFEMLKMSGVMRLIIENCFE